MAIKHGLSLPASAALTLLTDLQLAKALVHHEYVLQLPQDWWVHPDTGQLTACTVRAVQYEKMKGQIYLRCHFIDPVDMRHEGMQLQLPLSHDAQIEQWNIRRLISFNRPQTLADIGVSTTATVTVSAALAKAWASLLPSPPSLIKSSPASLTDRRSTHEPSQVVPGPFDNDADNMAWATEVAMDSNI
eukprot:2008104-Rhodomonas_salina.1